jgi:hypothetical protein
MALPPGVPSMSLNTLLGNMAIDPSGAIYVWAAPGFPDRWVT